jgi:hypothetical protein
MRKMTVMIELLIMLACNRVLYSTCFLPHNVIVCLVNSPKKTIAHS